MHSCIRRAVPLLLGFALFGFAHSSGAQDYPAKPVRIVDPFSPGGGSDLLARTVAQKLTERLGQSFVVENRAGGGGHIGADVVVKSPPNGYTLLVAGVVHAIGMTLYKKLPYDMAKDLAPVGQIATFASLIVVHPSLPARSIKELLALARSRPGELNYGANPGSPNHLAMELFNVMGKVKLVHIGYKGAGPVVIDLVGGQLHLASLGIPSVWPHVQSGRVRVLAVTSKTRSPMLPAVPTVSESGLPGYDVTSWYGFYAPAGTPGAVIAKLNSELRAVLTSAEVSERLSSQGAQPAPISVEEFGRLTRDEIARWGKIVRDSGAKVD
jgi:tripartite-type tricarboxylate transporter receptor subunit TctC